MVQAAARKAVTERLSSLDLEVPTTSVEFMRGWKRVRSDPSALHAFLKRWVGVRSEGASGGREGGSSTQAVSTRGLSEREGEGACMCRTNPHREMRM